MRLLLPPPAVKLARDSRQAPRPRARTTAALRESDNPYVY